MKITWLGHSSFLVEDSKGRKLLTDPFNETVGYKLFTGDADVVTVSHQHFDHSYTEKLGGDPKIVDKVGFFYECDIDITGIPSYHDKSKGAKRGENVIFVFQMDGYRLCHLGDLGHALSEADIDKIGHVDVLFLPVGGNFTIDGKEASEIANSINSRIVIPMHYKTPALSFPLGGLEEFLLHMKNGDKVGGPTLTIDGELEENNVVKILDYVR